MVHDMSQPSSKTSALTIAAVVVAGVILYVVTGGPDGPSDADAVKKPSGAVEMTVSSVRPDGTFRGKIERSGRYADEGLQRIGTYDRVTLRLADVEPPQPVRDPCWIEEGQKAVKDLIGARIWIDPQDVQQQGSGTFTVYAWNRKGTFVQEQLLRDGDGKAFAGRLSVRYRDSLTSAEDEAAAAERGLWGACGTA